MFDLNHILIMYLESDYLNIYMFLSVDCIYNYSKFSYDLVVINFFFTFLFLFTMNFLVRYTDFFLNIFFY